MAPPKKKQQHLVPPSGNEDVVAGMAGAPILPGVPQNASAFGSFPSGVVPAGAHGSRVTLGRRAATDPTWRRPANDNGRRGPETGAKIVLMLRRQSMPSGEIASRLGMDESHIRRTCRMLAEAGLLLRTETAQAGTPPFFVYSLPPLN